MSTLPSGRGLTPFRTFGSSSAAGFLVGLWLAFAGCSGSVPASTCVHCHQGIEPASANHGSCVSCHGGDPAAADKDASHRAMRGGRNPAAPAFWQESCGGCHAYQVQRVAASLMQTNTGIIKNTQLTWEGSDGHLYASRKVDGFGADGEPLALRGVKHLRNLSGELYRKFCSRCHVGAVTTDAYSAHHDAGCAACHFPFNDAGTYEGGDVTVSGKRPYSASHAIEPLPDSQVCLRCHSRSGRIAHYYTGLNDGNNALVPSRGGEPGPRLADGLRSLSAIPADVHYAAGMECIDCHTSRDVMGDGYLYENMYQQVEILCEDCHGGPQQAPRSARAGGENRDALRESKNYPQRMDPGRELVLTAKGRPYSNVYRDGERVVTLVKRSGKPLESKVITGTPEHTIHGHQRLECYSCHSRTVAQCYGCHTEYDQTRSSRDYITGQVTPGEFTETEDYRALYPFPLAVNQRDRVSPVTPGCQTFVTVVDERGRTVAEEWVARFKGKPQLRFAPFYSHNTGKRAVGCVECHSNPAFFGFGQAVVAGADIRATFLCERSGERPLDGYVVMRQGRVQAFSAITREVSRPLNTEEVKRVFAVNLCLLCHERGNDPIYQAPLDYAKLEQCLARGPVRYPAAEPGR